MKSLSAKHVHQISIGKLTLPLNHGVQFESALWLSAACWWVLQIFELHFYVKKIISRDYGHLSELCNKRIAIIFIISINLNVF